VVDVDWSIVGELDVDTCPWVANNRRTRGPIQGCHVSLTGWLRGSMYKMLEAAGFDPWTSPPHSAFANSNNQLSARRSLL
jgi:hypothetical protein